MGNLNKVLLIGNLGRDPESRTTQAGEIIVTLSVATNESWTDKRTGERIEKSEWHRVVIFNSALAKIAEQYLRKGSQVYIEGKLQTRKWTDQSGADRYTTEVVLAAFGSALQLLDRRDAAHESRPGPGPGPSPAQTAGGRGDLYLPNDDIPF